MNIAVVRHATPAAFLQRARPFLLAREAERSLLLGVAQGMPATGSTATMLTAERDGQVDALLIHTAPHKALLSDGPLEAIDALQQALRGGTETLVGVMGPAETAQHFARAWSGDRAAVQLRMRLHRLETLVEPPVPGGTVRAAIPDDRGWLAPWARHFIEQSGSDDPRTGEQLVAPYLDRGTAMIWEDPEPRCVVGWSRETPNGASISLVFTPAEHRGRGYATALTAEVSRRLLSRGKRFVVLFTNLADPTANAIYARLGYRPLADHESWQLDQE